MKYGITSVLGLALWFVGTPIAAQDPEARADLTVEIGVAGVENVTGTFRTSSDIPNEVVAWLSAGDHLDVFVDGEASAGAVAALRMDLASRGVSSIRILRTEGNAPVRTKLSESGRIVVTVAGDAPESLDRATPMVWALAPEIQVLVSVDGEAPVRHAWAAMEQLQAMGPRRFEVR